MGALFYRNCASILAQLEEAELAITQLQTVPRGLLRVSAPEDFGSRFVAPVVAQFMESYAELEIELSLDDRRIDPIEEGFDIVIRLGETASRTHLSREIAPLRRLVVASPRYLDRMGVPNAPDELEDHQLLLNNSDPSGNTWQLHGPGAIKTLNVQPILSSNHDQVLYSACIAGRGIAYLPDYLVGSDLREGRLSHVLPHYVEDTVGIHAIYPEQKHLSARIRLFIDALVENLGPNPPWAVELDEY